MIAFRAFSCVVKVQVLGVQGSGLGLCLMAGLFIACIMGGGGGRRCLQSLGLNAGGGLPLIVIRSSSAVNVYIYNML